MTKCMKCKNNKPLVGTERKNGKKLNNHNGKDWEGRKFCKKCVKDLIETQKIYFNIYCNDDERLLIWIKEWKDRWGLKKLL